MLKYFVYAVRVVGVIMFFMAVGTVGALECEDITIRQAAEREALYLIGLIVCLIIGKADLDNLYEDADI